MRTLFFDCFAGASGDMILGALFDLGVPVETVRTELEKLALDGWGLGTERVRRAGVRATKAHIDLATPDRRRAYRNIVSTIRSAPLQPDVAGRALRTFALLAEAEARVHDLAIDDVHFHEVGSLDAIIDVVGASAALEHLRPERVVTSPLAVGTGLVRGSHGTLPVPPPAVIEVLSGTGAVIEQRGRGELLTPTGAALLAANSDAFGPLPAMTVEASGYGAGTRETEAPNVLRVLWGVARSQPERDVVVIECNLDDMSPELLPDVIERLFVAGAQDAWVTPIVMKKGRPAFTLSVLADRARVDEITALAFDHTTTLGVRISPVDKIELERSWTSVDVDGHSVWVKVGRRGGRVVTSSPEYEDALAAARATGLPLKEIYRRVGKASR